MNSSQSEALCCLIRWSVKREEKELWFNTNLISLQPITSACWGGGESHTAEGKKEQAGDYAPKKEVDDFFSNIEANMQEHVRQKVVAERELSAFKG